MGALLQLKENKIQRKDRKAVRGDDAAPCCCAASIDCDICYPVPDAVFSFDSTGWPACCIPGETTIPFSQCISGSDVNCGAYYDFRWQSATVFLQLIYIVSDDEWFVSCAIRGYYSRTGKAGTAACWNSSADGLADGIGCDESGFYGLFDMKGIVGGGGPPCDCTGLTDITVTI